MRGNQPPHTTDSDLVAQSYVVGVSILSNCPLSRALCYRRGRNEGALANIGKNSHAAGDVVRSPARGGMGEGRTK